MKIKKLKNEWEMYIKTDDQIISFFLSLFLSLFNYVIILFLGEQQAKTIANLNVNSDLKWNLKYLCK